MDDVVVVKAAHHVYDRVAFADVRQELVAQALALGRALHQSRDINELDDSGGVLVRVIHLGELVQPLIRHRYHADVRLDGAEGIVRALRARVRDRVKESGLADIRQPDNS